MKYVGNLVSAFWDECTPPAIMYSLCLALIRHLLILMNELAGGIWPVMLSPFTDKGEIDFNGLEVLTEFYLASGASGLFANCLSSEMFQLSPEERLNLTKAVVNFAAGRVPVISTGNFSQNHEVNLDFISRIYDKGVAGVVINSNQFCDKSDGEEVFRSKLESLVEATGDIPLGIYECPVPYKRLLSQELLAWIVSSNRFIYYKDTCCDNELIRDRISVCKGSRLFLFNANTPTSLKSLRDGAAGLSPIGANFYPELYSYLYQNGLKEETLEFKKVWQFLSVNDPVVHALYPFSAKWFLQQRGLPISTYSRTHLPKAHKKEMIRLQELLYKMEVLNKILKQ